MKKDVKKEYEEDKKKYLEKRKTIKQFRAGLYNGDNYKDLH